MSWHRKGIRHGMEILNFKNPTEARNQKHLQFHQKLFPYKDHPSQNRKLSLSRTIENNVPQGSVLSVSLFFIAINDVMTNLSLNPVKEFLFADDLTIICRGENQRTAQTLLQNSKNNRLSKPQLNTTVKYSPSSVTPQMLSPQFYTNGQTIQSSTNAKTSTLNQ